MEVSQLLDLPADIAASKAKITEQMKKLSNHPSFATMVATYTDFTQFSNVLSGLNGISITETKSLFARSNLAQAQNIDTYDAE